MWLSQANLGGALISTEQYGDEILAVLANDQALVEEHKKLLGHPAISSCAEKQCIVYHIATTNEPKQVLSSFPLSEGEEWYLGTGKTAYLCLQAHQLSDKQISWLANNTDVTAWQDLFDLTSMPVGR